MKTGERKVRHGGWTFFTRRPQDEPPGAVSFTRNERLVPFSVGLTSALPRSDPMNCPNCKRSLTEIDYYGELLTGCIECNRWGRPGDKTLVMELLEADLQALRKARSRVRCSRKPQ